MKTAIYIEDGVVQLVITPENKFEKNALSTFQDKPLDAKIFAGAFYDARGGWVSQTAYNDNHQFFDQNTADRSLIIKMSERKEPTDETILQS